MDEDTSERAFLRRGHASRRRRRGRGAEKRASGKRALLLREFGDLGFLDGEWSILGSIPDWDRHEWPMPPRIRVDEEAGKAWLSYYDESTFECLKEERVDPALADSYPEDGVSGYGAVEIRLTRLLDKEEQSESETGC